MTYLLDVSALLAWLLDDHPENARLLAWETGKTVAVCPITELGFLRIACNTYGASLPDARQALAEWKAQRQPAFVPCAIPTADGEAAPGWKLTTDFYLGNLAAAHQMKLATLDGKMGHPAAEAIC